MVRIGKTAQSQAVGRIDYQKNLTKGGLKVTLMYAEECLQVRMVCDDKVRVRGP